MNQCENKMPSERMAPEQQLEICNAINAAVAAGKIVTVEYPDMAHTTQIAGAFPNVSGVILVVHLDWRDQDSIPILWLGNKHAITAHFPAGTDIDVIRNPNSTS